jgi:alanine racemase
VNAPLRLRLDGAALVANWHWLAGRSIGAACGAAVKADGYGLGAYDVVSRLYATGCRDFFVATWREVAEISPLAFDANVSVLHGVREADMAYAVQTPARPVLNTPEQVVRWKPTHQPCDVMVDTGMNRLGISAQDIADGLLDGLWIETLMSHLACADEDSPMNARQRAGFAALDVPARRRSLANSAGICLGFDYIFDVTRPGLALYGGIPRAEAAENIAQVVFPEAQVIQRRRVSAGDSVGYGAAFVATRDIDVAILNIGYADGYLRSFGNRAPVLGRVSMDLLAVDVTGTPAGEGDWLPIDYALPEASAASGLSQYELLTGLGERFDRIWF